MCGEDVSHADISKILEEWTVFKLNLCSWLSHLSCVNLDKLIGLTTWSLDFSPVWKDYNLRKVLLRLKEIISESIYLLPPT